LFITENIKKTHKKHHGAKPIAKRAKRRHSHKLRTPEQAKLKRKERKIRRQRRKRIEKRLIRKLKRKSERYVKKKCFFSRVCRCKVNGKKVAYTKKISKKKLFKRGCSVQKRCRRCPNMLRVKKLRARRAFWYRKIRESHRRPTKISKLRALIRNKRISRRRRVIALRRIKHIRMEKRIKRFNTIKKNIED